MRLKSHRRRLWIDRLVRLFAGFSAVVGIFFLLWILWTVVSRGAAALNLTFFLKGPAPPGVPGGGLGNAVLGTLILTLLATLFGVPLGLLAGIFLSEFGRHHPIGGALRFVVNVLMGVPSIIVGLFVWAWLVVPLGGVSGLAGAVALAVLMVPVVVRTTEDMLRLMPDTLRESVLALGAPRWRMVAILLRGARTGLLTGVLLAVARISGETAPLLFTALNSPYWPRSLLKPMANLTVTIYNYALSPYPNWQQLAWGASLLITLSVLALTLVSRIFLGGRKAP